MPGPRVVGFSVALALHLSATAIVVWLAMPTLSRNADGRQAVTAVAPRPTTPAPKPRSREDEVRADLDRHLPTPPDVRVWGFTFDLRKVRSRWSALFPFVTTPPRFDIDAATRRASSSRGFVFVDPNRVPPTEPPARPALVMSPSAIQRLVDRAWTRRERWSRNTLGILLRTRPRRDLQWTYQENPDAFWLFDSLREYYGNVLDTRGLTSAGAVKQYYEDQRLELLATVLRQTPAGYRAGDAHFVIGKMHWARGDRRAAIREWRQMRALADDAFVATYARIVQAVDRLPAGVEDPDPPTIAGIEAALDAERQNWRAFQYDRLRQFGHGAYTF